MRNSALTVFLVLVVALAGCGKKKQAKAPIAGVTKSGGRMPAIPVPLGYTENGLASWYGHPYHGRQAADGEIYDMETMVAAHRTLPFQTMVRVTLQSTGKSVDVRVIDRGPFVDGRIIDLSHAAAVAIGLIGPGTGRVSMEVIKTATEPETAGFGVQVGLFRDEANADKLVLKMSGIYGSAKKVIRGGTPPSWRVIAGRLPTEPEAEELAKRIRTEQNVPEAFVVRIDAAK